MFTRQTQKQQQRQSGWFEQQPTWTMKSCYGPEPMITMATPKLSIVVSDLSRVSCATCRVSECRSLVFKSAQNPTHLLL